MVFGPRDGGISSHYEDENTPIVWKLLNDVIKLYQK